MTISAVRLPKTPAGRSGAAQVARAVTEGLIVHIPHPDFGGTITAGLSRRADGSAVFELIAHGCSIDVGAVAESAIELGRMVETQVGSRRAYWAAWDRIADAALEVAA